MILYRLFLKLAVRGPVAHWASVQAAPKSAFRLAGGAVFFAAFGLIALMFVQRRHELLLLYLHATTLVLLPLYLVAAAGDLLSDRDETLALAHLPIRPRAWCRAKFLILVQLAAWAALALNLTGLFVGSFGEEGRPGFAAAHLLSLSIETVFCLACVMFAFQARRLVRPLRRSTQVCATMGAVLLCGLLLALALKWFVGMDEALLGGGLDQVVFGFCGMGLTAGVLWLALKVLPDRSRVLSVEEIAGPGRQRLRRSFLLSLLRRSKLATVGLNHPAEQASFTLTVLYLIRSRDVKMRLLGSLSLVYAMPLILLLTNHGEGAFGLFSVAVTGAFLSLYAFLAIFTLELSSDWQAARIFLSAPLQGPGELCAGARRAILVICVLPTVLLYAALVLLLRHDPSTLLLLLPGLIPVPFVACMPNTLGRGVPLATAPDSGMMPAGQGSYLWVLGALAAAAIGTAVYGTWHFWLFLGLETAVTIWFLRRQTERLAGLRWLSSGLSGAAR